ncbi:alpha carbonic anhydrase 8-like [Hibiscus syriacus]|uniref:alpha carbonic anhydrase 8-like n=1 Tax=Hibiscus syriacus TaxID=106335 RepID=UPI001922B4B4|nr:alpha carbonic anhydrase 8-like [Hibiscus syriacus]
MEGKERVKKDDKVWVHGLGTGLKCCNLILECLRTTAGESKSNPWNDYFTPAPKQPEQDPIPSPVRSTPLAPTATPSLPPVPVQPTPAIEQSTPAQASTSKKRYKRIVGRILQPSPSQPEAVDSGSESPSPVKRRRTRASNTHLLENKVEGSKSKPNDGMQNNATAKEKTPLAEVDDQREAIELCHDNILGTGEYLELDEEVKDELKDISKETGQSSLLIARPGRRVFWRMNMMKSHEGTSQAAANQYATTNLDAIEALTRRSRGSCS